MTDDYQIGRGKPPTATRFRKGKSGNPTGRPKGARNLKTDLEAELAQRIHVKENEQPLTISKQRALVKTMTAKALKGDTRAATIVLNMVAKLFDQTPPADATPDLGTEDRAILDDFLRRQLQPNNQEQDDE